MDFKFWLLDLLVCAFVYYFDWLDAEFVVLAFAML